MKKNKLLNEINTNTLLKDIEALKSGTKEFKKFEDLIKQSSILDKNKNVLNSVDDIKNAITNKTIGTNELNKVTTSFLKSSTDPVLIQKWATEIRKNKNAMNDVYSTAGKKGITPYAELKSRGYNDKQITSILGTSKPNPKGVVKSKKSPENVSQTAKSGDGGISINAAQDSKVQLNITQNQGLQQIDDVAKAGGNIGEVAKQSSESLRKITKNGWEKLKNIGGKLKKRWILKLGLGTIVGGVIIAGGGYLLWKSIFGENPDPNDKENQPLNDCFINLLNKENTIARHTSNGDPAIQITTTGNQEYDQHKGLLFFVNNRVTYGDKTRKGSWSCNNVINENNLPVDVNTIKENIIKINNINDYRKKSIINEQEVISPISNILFKWDDEQTNTADSEQQTQQPVKSKFHDCAEFPFEFGCRNQAIKDIQTKLEFEPKYQTGNF